MPSLTGRTHGGTAWSCSDDGYHGHDAVVHVVADSEPAAPAIVVRTLGGCALPAPSPVTLHARGPVLAWNQ